MSIVATEIESIHGATDGPHSVYYRCQDHLGDWHSFGPIEAGPGFDAEAYKTVVAATMPRLLADAEFDELMAS